jgi:hypothetical protein
LADEQPKDVKLRPVDKVIGGVVTAGGVAGLAATVWAFLPLILALFASTIALIVGGVIVVGLLFAVSDASLRGVVGRAYRLAVHNLGLMIVRHDPIGALRDHINQLRERAKQFIEHRTTLKGIVNGLRETVKKLGEERDNLLAQASTAREMGDERVMTRAAKAADRRLETYEYLDGQLQQLIKVEDVLGKLAQQAQDIIEDCEDELSQLNLRDKASAAASGALRSALDILGDNDMNDQQREAVAIVEERVGRRLAEIDIAMDKTTGLIGGIDVKNATVNKQALAAVLEYEKRQPVRSGTAGTTARKAAVSQKLKL